MKPQNYSSENPEEKISEIPDVQGIIRDLLVHEEKAARCLDRIVRQLEGVQSTLKSSEKISQVQADQLVDGFMEQVGRTGDIPSLLDAAADTKNHLAHLVDELNHFHPSAADYDGLINTTGSVSEREQIKKEEVIIAGGMVIGGIAGLITGGALVAPAFGMVTAIPGMAAGWVGSLTVADAAVRIKDMYDEMLQMISRINDAVDELGGFAEKIDQASDWMRVEISKLEDEEPQGIIE